MTGRDPSPLPRGVVLTRRAVPSTRSRHRPAAGHAREPVVDAGADTDTHEPGIDLRDPAVDLRDPAVDIRARPDAPPVVAEDDPVEETIVVFVEETLATAVEVVVADVRLEPAGEDAVAGEEDDVADAEADAPPGDGPIEVEVRAADESQAIDEAEMDEPEIGTEDEAAEDDAADDDAAEIVVHAEADAEAASPPFPRPAVGGTSPAGAAATPLTIVPEPAAEPAAVESRRRWRTIAQVAAWTTAVVAVAVVLLVFVFPTRTYLNQRHQLTQATDQLRLLDQQNAQLSAQVARLETDSEIARIAREQYHLVRPGESAFAILPAPTPATLPPLTNAAPKTSKSVLKRLTGWIP